VAWALPEVEVGVELEVMPLELEEELVELEEAEEPVLVELEEAPEEPVLVEPVEDDEPVEVRLVAASAVCVDPGRTKATALAATTLATPTVAVTTRIRARPRVLAVTASAIGPGCELELVMSFSLEPGARGPLQATSQLALKLGVPVTCRNDSCCGGITRDGGRLDDRDAYDPEVRLIGVTAWGGAGKTALVTRWVNNQQHQRLVRGVFG
jgi:hypothetical protein